MVNPAHERLPVRPCVRCGSATACSGAVDEALVAPAEEDIAEGQDVEIQEEVETIPEARDPGRPTLRQIMEHRVTHLPYRLWCKWCVLGRGRGFQHRKSYGSSIAIIGLDYFFVFTHSFWQPIRGNRGSQVGTDPPSHSHLWRNAVIYTYFSNLVSQWSWCAAAAETTSRTRSSSTGNASGRRAAGHVRPVTWLREERV